MGTGGKGVLKGTGKDDTDVMKASEQNRDLVGDRPDLSVTWIRQGLWGADLVTGSIEGRENVERHEEESDQG